MSVEDDQPQYRQRPSSREAALARIAELRRVLDAHRPAEEYAEPLETPEQTRLLDEF